MRLIAFSYKSNEDFPGETICGFKWRLLFQHRGSFKVQDSQRLFIVTSCLVFHAPQTLCSGDAEVKSLEVVGSNPQWCNRFCQVREM